MKLATKMQNKLDEVWEENWDSDSKLKRAKAKAAASLSGGIDGAVIAYPIMVGMNIAAIVANRKRKRK